MSDKGKLYYNFQNEEHMEKDDIMYRLAATIEDIQHDIALMDKSICTAHASKAAARKARKISLKLGKSFLKFRKLSCQAGLK